MFWLLMKLYNSITYRYLKTVDMRLEMQIVLILLNVLKVGIIREGLISV